MKNRLKYTNNWEADIYTINGKRVKKLEEVRIDGNLYKITTKFITVPYDDHGHNYYGQSDHYFITLNSFGKVLLDINKFVNKIKVEATKFEVEEENET